jgi:tetratricopeptide (TPR) repeat protein
MSTQATGRRTEALAWAEEAHALVRTDPRKALALAKRALTAASADGDDDAQVAATNALAWAQRVLGDEPGAERTLRAGIRLAKSRGDRRATGILGRQLAVSLAFAGKARAARREIEAALSLLNGRDRAHAQVHRVTVHTRGHTTDLETHRRVYADALRALRTFRRDGDEVWEARLLYNLGLLHLDRGELERATGDFSRARALYTHTGARTAAIDALVQLAEIQSLRGDILACLKAVEEVQATLPPDELNFNLEECRVGALARARLLPEARAAATAYAELCTRSGRADGVAITKLDLAAISLAAGDPDSSRQFAAAAMRSFAARNEPVNAALGRAAWLRAKLAIGDVTRTSVATGLSAVSALERAGWRRDALRTRVLSARVALAVGSATIARHQLELGWRLWARGTVTDKVELCHARALLQLSDGDSVGAVRQLERGLALLDEYQAALGAVELRATASGIGSELSELGLRIAIERGEPVKILRWVERQRANALRFPTVRPPADKKLGDLQTELRRAVADGRVSAQAQLETAIRSRARLVDAAEGTQTSALDVGATTPLLGERALIEYAELDGALYALTLVDGKLELRELGAANAGTELGWLRFAYGRIAAGRMTSEQRVATRRNADASAAALDKLLVEPMRPVIGDRPLVVVPTGALHAIPWSALPSLRGRPVVVAPSFVTWSALAARPRSRRRKVVLVAGPRLRHSAAEARELGALFDKATVLTGKTATAAAALKALDGAALAHIACHGHFRSDSPLFSSLELADGPLNVYELQTLRQAPEMVVLSACDLATSDLHPGDEVLGLAAALLAMGTRTIVASVVPVPDAAVKRLMLAFHRNLLAGDAPAAALARAQSRTAVAGFVCLGSD